MVRPASLRAVLAVVAIAASAFAVACDEQKAQHPTAPVEAAPVAAVVSPEPSFVGARSTVCMAYMNKRSVARDALAKAKAGAPATAPNDGSMKATRLAELDVKVEKLDKLTLDACR